MLRSFGGSLDGMRAGFHTRAVLVHQVFLKVLSLSPAEWAHFSTGRVFNLVTSDVETLQLLSQSIMNLISSPLRIIVRPFRLWGSDTQCKAPAGLSDSHW